MRWKLIAGWMLAVALLVGLQLLPGPNAEGATVPATITSSVAQNTAGTALTLTWTIQNTSDVPAAFFIYGCLFDPAQCNPTFGNGSNQLFLAAGASSSWTQELPCGTTTYVIDVVDYGVGDLPGSGTTDVACVPPTTTTTTVPVTPPTTPPSSAGGGNNGTPPPNGSPLASPSPVVSHTDPTTLAFTGFDPIPFLEAGLGLIAAGILLLRLRKRLAT